MMAWMRLIRWPNLLIVFLTQLLAWGCVILPARHYAETPLLLDAANFMLLAISTVLIAAAGYIINDYFDIKIDVINRPDKVILEKRIPMKMAIVMHSVFNIVGIILAAIVARRGGHYSWLIIQLFCTLLLWTYSTTFKRKFMSGNVIIALLTALTIITLIVYEPGIHVYLLRQSIIDTASGRLPNPVRTLAVYAYFAFMLTWMREIVKDMEDFKGDAEQGCVTMPIQWGLKKSAQFVMLLGFFTLMPLVNASFNLFFSRWWVLGIYTLVALVLPITLWTIQLQKMSTQQQYHKASRQIKLIMVLGIGSLIIYYFLAHG